MSDQPEKKPDAPAKPPRSPVERAIVWGVIFIGLVVIGFEANSHFACAAAHDKLQAKLEDNRDNFAGVTKKDVDQIVGNKSPESKKLGVTDTDMAANRLDVYSYPGLLKTRKLYIYYGISGKAKGDDAEVLKVTLSESDTLEQAMAKQPKRDPSAPPAQPAGGAGPMMPPGMAGGGRGGPGGPPGGRGGPGGPSGAAGARPATEGDATQSEITRKDGETPDEKTKADDKPTADKAAEEAKPDADKKADEAKPADTEAKQE